MRADRSAAANLTPLVPASDSSKAPDPDPGPKPVSDRKKAANRANAQKSTGPRTDAGKARASLNAISHGLSSARAVLPDEDADEYARSIRELEADMKPRGALERQLVHRIGGLFWRLARVARIEQALWECREAGRQRDFKVTQMSRQMFPTPFDAIRSIDPPKDHSDAEFIASQFEMDKTSAIEKLAIYEQRLGRQLHAAMREFRELRKIQNEATEETPPAPEQAPAPRNAALPDRIEDENDKTKPPKAEAQAPHPDGLESAQVEPAPPGAPGAQPEPEPEPGEAGGMGQPRPPVLGVV